MAIDKKEINSISKVRANFFILNNLWLVVTNIRKVDYYFKN